ncbi:PaaI family thioesterase [Barnesiella sp. An55]|uniref:PaaI family thioesterase n=1 Tax=Barnesiella sp. An55 TaxID=1965646 RepID=UPI000B36BB3F|nr:PaaI family thioesterase [Barnesiella sp. An55]OUN71499.1 thioesterase [Barnesiella sp. An55]HIZ26880.1 PaaI family thioesterase [Candidatus Barnesiella merdipullorum]
MKKIINPWTRLEKDGYNCFGCAPNNPWGLKMEFYEDGDDIVSYWNPSDNYQGWLHTLHGGIQSVLIDEIAGWLVARKLQTSGMTTSLEVKFKRPITTGPDITLEVRAHLVEMKRNFAFIAAQISCDNQVCTQGELTYYCFSKEKAQADFHFTSCPTVDEVE